MFGSIYKILSKKLNNRCIASTLSRGLYEQRAKMEEHFKNNHFSVTETTENLLKNFKCMFLKTFFKFCPCKAQFY